MKIGILSGAIKNAGDYLPQDVVREEISKNIGTQFDEAPAKAMLAIIDEDTEYVMHE